MPATRSAFVNVLAWMSLALGVCGVLMGVLQAVLFATVWPAEWWTQAMAGDALVPPAMQWLMDHMVAISLASAVGSTVLGVVGWGLHVRREWARVGFIVLLVFGCLLPFASALFVDLTMDWMAEQVQADIGQVDPFFNQFHIAMQVMNYGFGAFIAAVHGWLAWKLCTPAIRAEFGR